MQKTKKKVVQEPSAEYETGEQYIPVREIKAALDAIFHEADYGLGMFARHEQNALDL